MGYTPGFETDIFISYAHVDNLPDARDERWVDLFHKLLETALARKFGRVGRVVVWRDKFLDGSQLFNRTIKNRIDDSAVFLALTSNAYFRSDYCLKELRWFVDKIQTDPLGPSLGDRGRLFNIRLADIPWEDWSDEFGGASGFTFHDAENVDDDGEPLDVREKPFNKAMRKLVGAIHKTLNAATEQSTAADPHPGGASEADAAFSLFFADVTDPLADVKTRAATALTDAGIHVLPGIPPPYESAPHETRVKESLAEARLCVHLLDGLPGRGIDGEPGMTYLRKQAHLARELELPQVVWAPPESDLDIESVADDAHRDLLRQFEKDPRPSDVFNFIRCPRTEISRKVREIIEQMRSHPPEPPSGGSDKVLLDAHVKDALHAMVLNNYLVERDIFAYTNPIEEDPMRNMSQFELRLGEVNTLIIIWGAVASGMVLERLKVIIRLIIDKNYPIETLCVYMAPPRKNPHDIDLKQRFIQIHFIDNSDMAGFDPAPLSALFEAPVSGGVR